MTPRTTSDPMSTVTSCGSLRWRPAIQPLNEAEWCTAELTTPSTIAEPTRMTVRGRDLCGVRLRDARVRGACEGGRASGCLLMTTSMVPSPECGLGVARTRAEWTRTAPPHPSD